MKAIPLSLAIGLSLPSEPTLETCREVVRDASGHYLPGYYLPDNQRRKSEKRIVSSATRDGSGRIIGISTNQPSADGKSTSSTYRDANGRQTGTVTIQTSSLGSSHTTYRETSGRTTEVPILIPLAALAAAACNTAMLHFGSSEAA